MYAYVRLTVLALLVASLIAGTASAASAAGQFLRLFVEVPGEATLTLDLEPTDSVANATQRVFDQTGTPIDDMRLVFDGELLDPHGQLADYGLVDDDTLQLVVRTPLVFTTGTVPAFVLNTPYSSSVLAAGGFGFLTYAVTAGSLPRGITFNPATGALTGTPTETGPWAFTITANSSGITEERTFSGTVAPQLAATGVDPSALIGGAAALLLVGASLLARGRRA